MADKQIHGAVLQSGRIYVAGDEAALALVLPPRDVDRLLGRGVLSGDWSASLIHTSTDASNVPETPAPPDVATPFLIPAPEALTGGEDDIPPRSPTQPPSHSKHKRNRR